MSPRRQRWFLMALFASGMLALIWQYVTEAPIWALVVVWALMDVLAAVPFFWCRRRRSEADRW